MNFSRIVRSIARSSCSRNQNGLLTGGSRLNGTTLSKPSSDTYLDGLTTNLQFLRGYIASVGARKPIVPKPYLSDLNYILAKPKFNRFLSSEVPEKKSNFRLWMSFDYKKILDTMLKSHIENKLIPKGYVHGDPHRNFPILVKDLIFNLSGFVILSYLYLIAKKRK